MFAFFNIIVRIIKCNFTSYLCKIGRIDKYFTILYYNTLHSIKNQQKPEKGSWGGCMMSYLILIT